MKRLERNKIRKLLTKKKAAVGAAIIGSLFILNIGVSFADVDVHGVLSNWYNKKAEIAQNEIDSAVKKETETQKQRIIKELKEKMQSSDKELSDFTAAEKKKRVQAVIDYADKIIKETNFSNEVDKKQIEKKLDEIEASAKRAMYDLKKSYTAPQKVYEEPKTNNKDDNSKNDDIDLSSAEKISEMNNKTDESVGTTEETNKNPDLTAEDTTLDNNTEDSQAKTAQTLGSEDVLGGNEYGRDRE